MAMMAPMTAAYGMPLVQPAMIQATAMPQMAVPQMAMQQQMAMPYGGMMGQPGMVMPGPMGQPVYINSLSQLPPGAVPLSQGMLAQALGQPGAQMVEQPSTISRVLKGAGLGAAAGAAFGIIPFLPLGLFSGALVGAGVGAAIALLKKPKPAEGEFHTMTPAQQQAMAQAQMIAATPEGARSATATTESTGQKQPVVMGPEMRKKWAAKVRAEKAAAAKAGAK